MCDKINFDVATWSHAVQPCQRPRINAQPSLLLFSYFNACYGSPRLREPSGLFHIAMIHWEHQPAYGRDVAECPRFEQVLRNRDATLVTHRQLLNVSPLLGE